MSKLRTISLRIRLLTLLLAMVLLFAACGGSPTTPTTGGTHPAAHPPPPSTIQPLTNPVIYVALGASDAVGVGSNQPGAQGYVPLLAARLPKGSHAINLGVSGIRLHEALNEELPIALTTAPNLVTIWLAANDFIGGMRYEDYMHDLNSLLQQLHTGTHARVVMANLPDLTLLPALAGQSATQKTQVRQQVKRWNAGIANAAARYGVIIVDLFSHDSQLTAHPEYISGDGFHPSARGYIQLANYFWQAINGN